jgi:predicted CXXCH cytochrome family protein
MKITSNAVTGLLLSGLLAFTSGASAQIVGSEHDFSGKAWNNTGEICVVCHTPHNADVSISEAPLWNHETSTTTFALYTSSTLEAVVGQPDGSSKMCLSCHDGTVALDNFGGTTTGTKFNTGGKNLGTSLTDDHPVSFDYTTALAASDGELADPSTATSGLGGTIDADMLVAGRLQCSSCHDVHNASGLQSLLVKSNSGSGLCITCHTK